MRYEKEQWLCTYSAISDWKFLNSPLSLLCLLCWSSSHFYLFVASGFQLLPSSCSSPRYLYSSSLLDLLPHTLCLCSPYFLGLPLTLFLTEQSNLSLLLLLVSFPEPRHTTHIDQRVDSNHILLAAQETILNNSQKHTQIFRN